MLGMLNAFAIWWRDELLSFVPRRLRNLRAHSHDALVIALEENGAVFRSVRGANITDLATICSTTLICFASLSRLAISAP